MRLKKIIFGIFLTSLTSIVAKSQSLPVGTPVLEEFYRRVQLSGLVDTAISFTIRPLNAVQVTDQNIYFPDTEKIIHFKFSERHSAKRIFNYQLLPFSSQVQINTDHPYGWNDGPMVPAKGLQTLISGGVFIQAGPLTVQLKPEIVMAANKDFDTFNRNIYPIIAAWYYDFYNNIDLPSRFGTSPVNKFYWGQSNIRLSFKSLSFGVSSENLWWGPGIHNSLLMSNDAPGFMHLTLNTVKPLQTPIGSFEGQLIAGRLKNSGYQPLIPGWSLFGTDLYIPKPDNRRYISGLVLTYHPIWVPGLFLGLTRSSQLYSKDLKGISDYLPFFPVTKSVTADPAISPQKDTRNSIFARWLWTDEHAEIYLEYGHDNNTNDFENSLLEPKDARGYVVGFRKLIPFGGLRNSGILVGLEATQLAESSTSKVSNANSWYLNKYIRQGYTTDGQSLGAGIGPGGNVQTLDISWVKALKKIGLQFERYLHNDDFYYYAFSNTKDWRRHWVDVSAGLNGECNWRNFLFSAKVQYIHSLDYQWYLDPSQEAIGKAYYVEGATANNIQLQAGFTYRF